MLGSGGYISPSIKVPKFYSATARRLGIDPWWLIALDCLVNVKDGKGLRWLGRKDFVFTSVVRCLEVVVERRSD